MNICYNGDSFKLLRKTENETINLILTDIPYNISRDNNFSSMGRQGFDWIWDSYTGVFKLEHLSCLCPLVKKTGSILVFSSFQQCGDLDEIMQKAGMVAKDKIIWNKCLGGSTRLYCKSTGKIRFTTIRDMYRSYDNHKDLKVWNGKKWCKVIDFIEYCNISDGLKIRLQNGTTLKCTLNHKWPTTNGLKRADELKEGDELIQVNLPNSNELKTKMLHDDDIGWLIGTYLAEGSRDSRDRVQINIHENRSDIVDRCKKIGNDYGDSVVCYDTKDSHGNSIVIYGKIIRAIIDTYIFGKNAHTKHLSHRAWKMSDVFLKNVLFGYLESDGHSLGRNYKCLAYRIGFCRNKALADDLRLLSSILNYSIFLRPTTSKCQSGIFPSYDGSICIDKKCRKKSDMLIVKIGKSSAREYYDIVLQDNPHLLAIENGVLTHNSNPMPRNTNRRYVSDKELINWYVKKNGKWTFNKKENESYLRSILNFPISTHLSKFHPTAKNVDLLAALIKIHSDPNDIVLDAFAGSFTTGLAAAKTGRQFVLCEIDEKFYENGKMLLTKNNIEFTDGGKR